MSDDEAMRMCAGTLAQTLCGGKECDGAGTLWEGCKCATAIYDLIRDAVAGERARIEAAVKAQDYDAWRIVSEAIRGKKKP